MIMKPKAKKILVDVNGDKILKRLSPLKYFLLSVPAMALLLSLNTYFEGLGLLSVPLLIGYWVLISWRANDITATKWRYLLKTIGFFAPYLLWFFPSMNKQIPAKNKEFANGQPKPIEPTSHTEEWIK